MKSYNICPLCSRRTEVGPYLVDVITQDVCRVCITEQEREGSTMVDQVIDEIIKESIIKTFNFKLLKWKIKIEVIQSIKPNKKIFEPIDPCLSDEQHFWICNLYEQRKQREKERQDDSNI